ncbi:hypothetical protein L227DRAFT_612944 [Lentinus tigrinus ALCF2SS1-6]|uniref:Squalene monooxygenase n=1 Tax=Lentinus tigrinus ALCF2SS1-6 TaxID=1328759 RepID=A0A5C2S3T2_9APHY|nr:hypothetical protein L227DRAFT_612944 [Lentinus tigrinus ALCF2SS1-6]
MNPPSPSPHGTDLNLQDPPPYRPPSGLFILPAAVPELQFLAEHSREPPRRLRSPTTHESRVRPRGSPTSDEDDESGAERATGEQLPPVPVPAAGLPDPCYALAKAKEAKCVEVVEATVSEFIECPLLGVRATRKEEGAIEREAFFADLTVVADGCFSNFRSQVMGKAAIQPVLKNHFVGLGLEDAQLPILTYGTNGDACGEVWAGSVVPDWYARHAGIGGREETRAL